MSGPGSGMQSSHYDDLERIKLVRCMEPSEQINS